MPKVTVIIPNFNHEKYLVQRINSVLNQTFQNFEVIILDDCSKDKSRLIIENYRNHPKVKHIIYNETNSGSTFKQWEKGINVASGNLIWIAESDDFCELTFLEKLLPFFTDNQLVLCYAKSIFTNENGTFSNTQWQTNDWLNVSFTKDGREAIKAYLVNSNSISNASAVIWKKSIFDTSYLNTDYKLCGDWFFYINILLKGKIGYYSEPLNYYRMHENNVRTKESKKLTEIKEILSIQKFLFEKKILLKEEYTTALKTAIKGHIISTNKLKFMSFSHQKNLFSLVEKKIYRFLFCQFIFLKITLERLFFHTKKLLMSNRNEYNN